MSARDLSSASRRRFLQQGAALTVALALPGVGRGAGDAARLPGSLQGNRRLDGWLRIEPDGTVTAFTGKVELGQGILTACVQIVAEELDVEPRRIAIVSGDTARTPNEGVTNGSQSIEQSGTALRFAAAEARQILLETAAARLGVAATELRVQDGTISAPGGTSVTYWQLTGEASLARDATAGAKPKPAAAHRVVGKSLPRVDLPAKVTGGPAYVHDMRLPGTLFGRVVRPPSPRARLLAVDDGAARAMAGVVAVVRDGSFLGIAAEREEQAIAAAGKLEETARWEEAPGLPPAGPALYEHMRRAPGVESVVHDRADPTAPAAVRTVQASYTRPFQAHAAMGPSCAVAHWTGGKLHVWSHTQGPFALRGDLARVFGIPVADVVVSHREGAGCYGHNGHDDVALDAALVARAVGGRPVKLQWTREDELGWEPYGSAMLVDLRAGVDERGDVVDWRHEVWSHTHAARPGDPDGVNLLAAWSLATPMRPGPARAVPQPNGGGDRNAVPLYAFPRQRVVNHLLTALLPRTSALRTLGAFANVVAIESFMDELASAAGADPVQYRLRQLRDPRARAVLEAVAAKAAWRPRERGDGRRGRGVGFAQYKNHAAYVAVVAEAEVDRASGAVRVPRIQAVVDAGLAVNPDGIANQIEGGVIQAASWTLLEQVRYDRTRILSRDWASYPILRMAEVPQVEVAVLDRPEERSVGVGEGSLGPTGAAIANAVANATGKRIRDLPLLPERIKAALAG